MRSLSSWDTTNPVKSGELAYTINNHSSNTVGTKFYQTIGVDDYPMPFPTGGHKEVYAHGTYRCDGELLPGTNYDNTPDEGAVIPPHNYSNGICRNDGCTKRFEEPTKDGDFFLLANAGNVEWFSARVAENGGSTQYYARLTADIDFENEVNLHSPIGPTTGQKFKGEFDGQGHRIKNMIINRPDDEGIGFFGWLQGNSNATIRNLIIDSSCSITARTKAGGLAGASQNEGALITIENVVNGASVTVSGQDAAGIVGGESGNKATYYVHNVVNTGTITSTHADPYAGALFCYQERGTVENFINLGTINGHLGGNIGRNEGAMTWKNVVDLSDTADKTQGVVEGLTTADIASGKLAFYMNDNAEDDGDVFFQSIGSDEYPLPFATSRKIYASKWDGINDTYYNNEEGVVTASNVTIDDNATAFAVPADATSVKAVSVSYSRTNVAGFNSVCLPFALTELPAGATMYKVNAISGDYVVLETATEAAAGEPVLVSFPADYEGVWTVELGKAQIAAEPVGTGALKGAFATAAIGEGKYKLNADGTAFGRTTAAATIKPFRAYVETESAAAELKIWNDETGVQQVEETAAQLNGAYSLSGQALQQLQKGVSIVRMSNGETKKIVVK